jgi:hypothetical protein
LDADEDGVAVPAKEMGKTSKSSLVDVGGGKLTERLLKQGLLTEEMIAEMQREWRESNGRGGASPRNVTDVSFASSFVFINPFVKNESWDIFLFAGRPRRTKGLTAFRRTTLSRRT